MNLQTKDFWERVKDEYLDIANVNGNFLLCFNSKLFKNAYRIKSFKYDIDKLASIYIVEHCIDNFIVGTTFLFNNKINEYSDLCNYKLYKIRIDFINWCIKRFS